MCCRIDPTSRIIRIKTGLLIFLLTFLVGFAGAKVFTWITAQEIASSRPR